MTAASFDARFANTITIGDLHRRTLRKDNATDRELTEALDWLEVFGNPVDQAKVDEFRYFRRLPKFPVHDACPKPEPYVGLTINGPVMLLMVWTGCLVLPLAMYGAVKVGGVAALWLHGMGWL